MKESNDVLKFAQFLKEAREKAGLTQSEVARALGYTTAQFISNWERGLSYPPMKILGQLSSLYKVKIDDLFEAILAISMAAAEESLRKQYKQVMRRRS